jgi:alkyl hydroperoxide reductase subunit AhpF
LEKKMSPLLNDEVKKQIQDVFVELKEPVHVIFFGTQEECQFCEDTLQLVEEVTSLSDLLQVSTFDINEDASIAEGYNIELAPSLVIAGEGEDGPIDFGIRYAGIPSGYEFSALIQDLLMVSGRDSGLQKNTRQFLAELTEPVHLRVFATPT